MISSPHATLQPSIVSGGLPLQLDIGDKSEEMLRLQLKYMAA